MKRKRTHGHGQQCGDCREWVGRRSTRRLNGNGKNTIKILDKKLIKIRKNMRKKVKNT